MILDKLVRNSKKASLRIPEILDDCLQRVADDTDRSKQDVLFTLLLADFNMPLDKLIGESEYKELIEAIRSKLTEKDDFEFLISYANIVKSNCIDKMAESIVRLFTNGESAKVKCNNLATVIGMKPDYKDKLIKDINTVEIKKRYIEVSR